MSLSLDDLLVILASVDSVSCAPEGSDHYSLFFLLDRKKLDKEVLIEDQEALLSALRESLQRLKEIDDKEAYFKSRHPGASASDCIGFLYEQIKQLKAGPTGLHRDIGAKLYEATIAHLQELHGRREAADKDAYKRREEAAEQAREKRKEYERQNANRERAENASYRSRQKYEHAFNEKARATSEEELRKRFEEVFLHINSKFQNAFNENMRSWNDAYKRAGGFNQKTPPPKTPGAKQKWYEILGVSPGADKATIKSAWRALAKKHHPDRAGGSNESMTRINAAKDEGLGGL